MATTVARRNSPRIGRPSSRTASPMDSKKTALRSEDNSRRNSSLQKNTSLPSQATSRTAAESDTAAQVTEPLAPPPRPGQTSGNNNTTNTGGNPNSKPNNSISAIATTNNSATSNSNTSSNNNKNNVSENDNNGDGADYFSSIHNESSQFSLEPNPFEQSFGAPAQETPGKTLLPSVAALTSPAIPGTSSTGGYNWGSHSLRSGPLSPAMLQGPSGPGEYFDGIGRGFPTPNESSLRTGLTPGGGGSMFPVPSPNSQALFQALQNGGGTPGTVDFHRTAMNAAARNKKNESGQASNPQGDGQPSTTTDKPQDQFASHDAEAANGLFMLAKGAQASNQYPVPSQQGQQRQQQVQNNSNVKQPEKQRRKTASMGSLSGPDASGPQHDSHEEASKPNTRGGRGRKTAKVQATASARRKADDSLQNTPIKRSKGSSGSGNVDPVLDQHDDDDDEDDDSQGEEPTHDANGRKMTDEEKRKNFLERNRVAALKCRQRKKQWLANLQAKVELFSTENDALSGQVTQLREEIVSLKGLLLAHKDCAMGQAQGLPGMVMNGLGNDVSGGFASHHSHPYGMAMQNGGNMQANMQRS